MSCGCGAPNDKHGDSRNITQDDLNNAAQAADISMQEAADNIADCCEQMSSGTARTQNQPSSPQDYPSS
ncbi:MAG TPA: hypothetical protein VHZ51_24835 [Ktedonobacteraceae bacterium]|jgi:hypothetical protein|nr:hypothetical protein [Ktedonobacteraceae bacterium]